ncbi:MAG: AAA family ATPase [Anaerolineae bacterium]
MIRLKRLYAHDFKQLREVEIQFPEAGRILVQGNNEAGKSTLFEAIFFALFGQALAAENIGRPNLDDLIGYEKSKARVELDLVIGDRFFHIVRTLNRGKTNTWQLDITNGERIEEIRGNRAVNDRLVAELGFDSEALLNTCFVEQKKLEKLEGLTKAKREESLSKLLNLERLLELEEKLRLRGEDEKMLSRLTRRVELALAQEELPAAQQELDQAEGQLKLIELCIQATRAADEKRAVESLSSQLQSMQAQRQELRTAVDQMDALDKARRTMGVALERFDLLAQQTAALEAQRKERAEVEQLIVEQLPAIQTRAHELTRLVHHLTHLGQVEAARAQAAGILERVRLLQEELEVQEEQSKQLTTAISEAEARAIQVDQMLREYEIGEALGQWATFATEAMTQSSIDSLVAEKEQARDAAEAQLRVGIIAPGILLVALVTATVFIPLALLRFNGNSLIAVGAGGALLIADAALGVMLIRWALHIWNQLEQATQELGEAEGEANMRRELVRASAERLENARARLEALGVPVPIAPELAQARRSEITHTLENKTRDELNVARDAAQERRNYVRAQRDLGLQRIRELESGIENTDTAGLRRKIDKAEVVLNRWRPRLAVQAAALQVEPDLQSVRQARQELDGERKVWQARIQQSKNLARQIAEGETRIQKLEADIQVAYDAGRRMLNGATLSWSSTLPRSAFVEVEQQLGQASQEQGGDPVRARLNALDREWGANEREHKLRKEAAQDAVSRSLAIVQELRLDDALPAQPSIEDLENLTQRLNKLESQDKTPLQARVRSLHQRVGSLRETCNRLERELNLQGESIDPLAAREERDTEEREQEERKHGAEIVLRARKRIVQKVLPATMDYLRRILPQLTRDRYHDAELDPETYKIRVWDERAGQSGAWKEKNIFSGGTKDQFSLALRLAFALATLPQERGTSPGFIFLDEPLGSFDEERAGALLYLLTDGEIGRAFDQILLISHVRVQESRFTHHLRLENGVVVESDLTSNQ